MNRFEYLNGKYENVDMIASVYDIDGGKCRVLYKNGKYMEISNGYIEDVTGGSHIVQIIPCVKPVVAIYECKNEEGKSTIFEEDVFYLGLCADGCIKPVVLSEGTYEIINVDNFKGLISKGNTWRESNKSEWDEICDILGFRVSNREEHNE